MGTMGCPTWPLADLLPMKNQTPDTTRPAPDDHAAVVEQLIAEHRGRPGPLLPLLHAVQHALGHVPASAVPAIAAGLNLSRAEVHGVIGYYHHFRAEPAGRHVVQVCRAESCQACGGDALWQAAQQALGCAGGGTRADGAVTLEPVYCLGLCASSPALQIDERVHARVTPEKLQRLVAAMEAGS
jgi:formate dehydrogenase subunit gamma